MLSSRATPTTNAASVDAEVEYKPSGPAIPEGKENWTMGDLVKVDEKKPVGVERRLYALQESCSAKRRKVPGSVADVVDLVVKVVDDTLLTSPGAIDVADPRINGFSGQLDSTGAEVISLTSKGRNLEGVRDNVMLEHEELLQKLHSDAKLSVERIATRRCSGFSRYHGVFRSIQGIDKTADGRNTGLADTLTLLRLLFEDRRKAEAVSSLTGPSQEGLWAAKLERALEEEHMKLKTLHGIASQKPPLRAEASLLRASVETLGHERRKIMTVAQNMPDLSLYLRKIRASNENLRRQIIELTVEVRERDVRATVESAKLEAVKTKLAIVTAKLAASRLEGASSRYSAHNATKGASKVEDSVSNALIAVLGVIADPTKRGAAFIGLELRNAVKQLSAQIKMDSQAAVSHIWPKIEHDDSEALRKVVTCRAVLHSGGEVNSRILPKTTETVAGFDEDTASHELERTEDFSSNQASDDGSGKNVTKDQYGNNFSI